MAKRKRKRPKSDQGSRFESRRAAPLPPVTRELPGSAAKQDEMSARRARRRDLHPPGDACDVPKLRLSMRGFAEIMKMALDATAAGDDFLARGKALPRHAELAAERMRRNVLRGGVGEPTPERNGGETEGEKEKVKESNAPSPGGRIRRARKLARLSVRALARKAGVEPGRLLRIERRECAPCLWTIHRVAEALQVEIDWLACVAREGGTVRGLCA